MELDFAFSQVVLGALAVLVPGGLIAALRYQRDDAGEVVSQQTKVTNTAVDVVRALRDELEHTRGDLQEERAARNVLHDEVADLRRELALTREELEKTKTEIVKLRRTLVSKGFGDV